MNPHFTFFGLTFYWYGVIMGLAIVLALMLVEYRAERHDRTLHSKNTHNDKGEPRALVLFFQHWSMALLVGGFVGARLWHVATDWQLYRNHWQEILNFSHGGLSILGAIVGGVITLVVLRRLSKSAASVRLLLITDVLSLILPFGQAFGRLGNFINQELYGLPSSLPWAITIDIPYRLEGYEAIARYHPLFLYEALALVLLGTLFWWLSFKKRQLLGSGFFTLLYFTCYSALRFGLDFLRLDRPVWHWHLGINQCILGLVTISAVTLWCWLLRRGYFKFV